MALLVPVLPGFLQFCPGRAGYRAMTDPVRWFEALGVRYFPGRQLSSPWTANAHRRASNRDCHQAFPPVSVRERRLTERVPCAVWLAVGHRVRSRAPARASSLKDGSLGLIDRKATDASFSSPPSDSKTRTSGLLNTMRRGSITSAIEPDQLGACNGAARLCKDRHDQGGDIDAC